MTLQHFVLPTVLALAAAAPASALQAHQQPSQQPAMTNADLMKLVQAGVPESAIIASIHEDRVAIQTQKLASGQYRIVPTSPLLPGEYGVALRPVSKSKQFSGADIMRGQGDGMIFNAGWSFPVPPDAKAN